MSGFQVERILPGTGGLPYQKDGSTNEVKTTGLAATQKRMAELAKQKNAIEEEAMQQLSGPRQFIADSLEKSTQKKSDTSLSKELAAGLSFEAWMKGYKLDNLSENTKKTAQNSGKAAGELDPGDANVYGALILTK